MNVEVVNAITRTGAVVIYISPYSPFLNPIENYFYIYKSYLKLNETRMLHNWHEVHMEALNQMNLSKGIKFLKDVELFNIYNTHDLYNINI